MVFKYMHNDVFISIICGLSWPQKIDKLYIKFLQKNCWTFQIKYKHSSTNR